MVTVVHTSSNTSRYTRLTLSGLIAPAPAEAPRAIRVRVGRTSRSRGKPRFTRVCPAPPGRARTRKGARSVTRYVNTTHPIIPDDCLSFHISDCSTNTQHKCTAYTEAGDCLFIHRDIQYGRSQDSTLTLRLFAHVQCCPVANLRCDAYLKKAKGFYGQVAWYSNDGEVGRVPTDRREEFLERLCDRGCREYGVVNWCVSGVCK
jgi:hypothetical protein